MKVNTISSFIPVIFFLFASSSAVHSQTNVVHTKSDHFQITIYEEIDSIIILQFTDLHLGSRGHWRDDIRTFDRIRKLVEMYDPHLLFITGDLFTGEKPYGSLLVAYTTQFFDGLNRPWFYVFGNHDPEGGFGHDKIYEIFDVSKWGILGFHGIDESKKYDYLVDIYITEESVPSWQVYAFDTGPHNGIKAAQPDQIEWYRTKSIETKNEYDSSIASVSIFHIPLIQYQELWNDETIEKEGVSLEKVYYEEDDGSLFGAFVEMGNIKATFCGHDHYNNYWGKYEGIILAYGYISGESTKEAWPTGGKLIKLPVKNGDIKIENVTPVFNDVDHQY